MHGYGEDASSIRALPPFYTPDRREFRTRPHNPGSDLGVGVSLQNDPGYELNYQ